MSKIIINGPESSGKTTLSEYLVAKYDARYIQDYTRIYLDMLDQPYTTDDLIIMAYDIKDLLDELDDESLWIIDTDIINIKVWYLYKYGSLPVELQEMEDYADATHLLCKPDIPWEADPLREHPEERDAIYSMYLRYMQQHNIPYEVIHGESRVERACKIMDGLSQS